MKIFKRSMLIFLFLIGIISMLSSCFLKFRITDKKAMERYSEKKLNAKFHQYKLGKRTIHYVESGNAKASTVLLFIHGSPGAWNAFENYLYDSALNVNYLMASVDRPGYGYSDFGVKEESLSMHSIVYAPILKKYYDEGKKIVLIGHSYGGPVIAKMGMDFEDVVSGLILIAPSIDPQLEKELWIQKPATWSVFKWMIPAAVIVSNEEILALKAELVKIMPEWKNLKMPIIFIQGGKDNLVDPANKDFATKQIVNAELNMMYYPELDHFIPFTHKEIVIEAIQKMQEKIISK
jgi:pimeloyl-ACP methyl ester carboxylesterase